jgi:raffinose/stachyose/melibiose transport system permease protein
MIPLVWQFIGLHMVILLAGLKTIPVELFESATVDGASSMRIFFSIVIPLLREVLIICVILATTGTLKSFEHSWSITRGGPGTASSFIATLMYKDAFLSNKYGYGSAISMTILFFAIVFTVAFRRLASRNAFEY